MISDLPAASYAQALPVFAGLTDNLVVTSVLAGYTRGTVLVDDLQAPRRGCIWNQQDTLLLAGDPGKDTFAGAFNDVLRDELIPDAHARFIPGLALYIDRPAWRQQLDPLLADMQPAWRRRYAFRCDGLPQDWRGQLPRGYTLHRLDATLLAQTAQDNHGALLGWILSFWPTTRLFLHNGVGFCIRKGDALASWCLSVYAGDNALEFGVATVEAYRNQGLATLATAACLDECLQRGLTPQWQCDAANQPSLAVARKVGFVRARAYNVYHLTL
jgi:RimJ/RimL family protein N-acetyltransferase